MKYAILKYWLIVIVLFSIIGFIFAQTAQSCCDDGRYKITTETTTIGTRTRTATLRIDKETGRTWRLVTLNGSNSWRELSGSVEEVDAENESYGRHSSERIYGTGRGARPLALN